MAGRLFVIFFTLALMAVLGGPARAASDEQEAVIKALDQYLRASYARDTDLAYKYLSEADQSAKSRQEYRSENGDYAGFTLKLARLLASRIELSDMTVSITDDRASVNFNATLPDANHPSLQSVVQGFDSVRLESLDSDARNDRLKLLEEISASEHFAVLNSVGEQWEMVRENGEWRVFVNWAEAIEVLFESTVSDSLEWEFYPSQKRILAQPGQTVQMSYHARNIGKIDNTGKARHTIGAEEVANYLEIIACFCFLEQALDVGESAELPLVFRVDYEIPEAVKTFTVRYDFYLESEFPEHEPG